MDGFSVVIAGGGVAAIEGALRLRRLAGDSVKIALLAPNEEFAFRALSVEEPFARGGAERHPLRQIAVTPAPSGCATASTSRAATARASRSSPRPARCGSCRSTSWR